MLDMKKIANSKITRLSQMGLFASSTILGAAVGVSTISNDNGHVNIANADTLNVTGAGDVKYGGFGGKAVTLFNPDNGKYVYCLDKEAVQNNVSVNAVTANTAGMASVIAQGALGPGHQGETIKKYGFDDLQAYAVTQVAIWKYLGENEAAGGYNDPNYTNPDGLQASTNDTYNAMNANQKKAVNELMGFANQSLTTTTAPNADQIASINNAAKSAKQAEVDSQVASNLTSLSASATTSLRTKLTQTQQTNLTNKLDSLKAAASNAVTIKPASVATTDADKKAMPNWYDGDASQGHIDSVTNGDHEFTFNISHANFASESDASITIPSSFVAEFGSALPSGTIIKLNDSVVTSDASKDTKVTLGYGKLEIDVPFSDQPQSGVNTSSAVAKAILGIKTKFAISAEAKAISETASFATSATADYSSAVDMGYTTTIQPTAAKDAQRLLMAVSATTKNSTSSVSGTVKASSSGSINVSLAPSAGQGSADQSASFNFNWGKTLGSLVVHKVNEDNTPLKGVTFELVQGSVTNSQVSEYVASNKLADGDGQLISLPKATDAKGNVQWNNLPFGTYSLLEISTNDGYKLAPDPTTITIDRHHVDVQNVTYTNEKDKTPKVSHSADTPTIHTTATVNGQKVMLGVNEQLPEDAVSYTGLKVGQTYVMQGTIMDKDTKKSIGVTGEETFTPTSSDGTVKVNFKIDDASKYAGKNLVVFENLVDKETGSVVASHADINDSGQTVTVTTPSLHTTATVDGKKTINPDGTVTVNDAVKYSGLVPNQTYTLDGVAEDKVTAKPVTGQTAGNVKFTASSTGEGTVNVPIKVDASKVGSKGMVMFEKATDENGKTVATHADINDSGQSIGINTPQTGSISTPKPLATTAETIANNKGAIALTIGSLFVLGSAAYVMRNKKNL